MIVLYPFLLVALYAIVVFSVKRFTQAGSLFNRSSIVKRAFDVCLKSLDSDIPSIFESTIYNIITIKKYHPNADYSPIIAKLNELAEKNNDASIRYKANLAINYLNSDDNIRLQPDSPLNDHEYVYSQIAEQLGNKLAVSN